MLLIEKLREYEFSCSEQIIIDYILKERLNIKDKTIKQISDATYTAPSTLIRIAKKAGYKGWKELKESLLKEFQYLDSHFNNIDANFPFSKGDSISAIANKIAILNKETIDDTLSLLNYDELQKAVDIISKTPEINLFAFSNNQAISQDFKLKMSRIHRNVNLPFFSGEQIFNAYNCNPESCGILISYTGETRFAIKVAKVLKERNIPLIVISSFSNNTISKYADCYLNISTREKLFSKISNFSTNNSICYILDVLYSCVFALNYDENLKYRIKVAKGADDRTSSSIFINEKED